MTVTDYIPNRCKYNIGKLEKTLYLISNPSLKINIDNGEAYATDLSESVSSFNATSIEFNETANYDDRFKFIKTITLTCDGYKTIKDLNEKYYIILKDTENNNWLVNYDFPAHITYEYTLSEEVCETVFTFEISSNIPTLLLNTEINITPSECNVYKTSGIKELQLIECYGAPYSLINDKILIDLLIC